MKQAQITIRLPDGTIETVRAEAFVLVTYLRENLAEVELSPHTFEYPTDQGWPIFESISVLGERLTRENGSVLQSVGQAVMRTIEMGRDMIVSANKELRKNQAES